MSIWRGRAGVAKVGVASGGLTLAGRLANGVIHGCYKNGSGDLRVVDSATSSGKNNETSLVWNQARTPGPQRPEGPQGPQGPAGSGRAINGSRHRRPSPTARV